VRTLRALLRLAALVPFTVSLCAVNAMVSRGSPGRRARFLHAWARGARRILGVRISVTGPPPRAPFLLACNHLGYLDIVVVAARLPCRFVAKSEVAAWPGLGPLVRSMGTIFVDRDRRADLGPVIDRMAEAVTKGEGVAFFPEGTSSDGRDVLPFRPSLFEAAVRTGYPVSCAGLRYATRNGDPSPESSVAWWGDMTFGGHFWRLLGLRGIDAELRFAAPAVPGDDRKLLAAEVRARIVRARGAEPEGAAECGRR
jgi:1-acyl-sn-glycerol-3-phosphate acyltransferase